MIFLFSFYWTFRSDCCLYLVTSEHLVLWNMYFFFCFTDSLLVKDWGFGGNVFWTSGDRRLKKGNEKDAMQTKQRLATWCRLEDRKWKDKNRGHLDLVLHLSFLLIPLFFSSHLFFPHLYSCLPFFSPCDSCFMLCLVSLVRHVSVTFCHSFNEGEPQ